jgi:hypothetical protein
MSQNVWVTIMPFGPVTNFLLAQKKIVRASLRLALISGTVVGGSLWVLRLLPQLKLVAMI